MNKISGRDTPALLRAIMAGDEFETYGSFAGQRFDGDHGYHGPLGRLSSNLRELITHDAPDYVVFSYLTPIAWHVPARDAGLSGDERTPEYWVVPDDRYSVTTSKHQGIVRHALVFATKRFPWPYDDDDPTPADGIEVKPAGVTC